MSAILFILLVVSVAFIVYLKRHHAQQHKKSNPVTEGPKPTQSVLQNYDSLTVQQEIHHYSTMRAETHESHYHDLP